MVKGRDVQVMASLEEEKNFTASRMCEEMDRMRRSVNRGKGGEEEV